ncbi:MAG: hypothetical protein HQ567_13135 [Candidatus Nealsonbacteria bacterium]|nr:hypothetical protein [Candidatus Nealsonbacteria bacterium]
MTETLQEYSNSRGVQMRVERAAGVIRGVKILGLQSRNGRTYLPEALAEAARLYEGAKVNVNHPTGGPTGPRDYRDRIGVIRNVTVRGGEGLFADFHFNPKHALSEQLAWDAEHAPQNVGFSHNVQARTARRGDRVVVEAITRVQSVDLVADPATTQGLFESAPSGSDTVGSDTNGSGTNDGDTNDGENERPELTVEDLRRDYPALVEQLHHEQADEQKRLRAEVDRLTAVEAIHRKQALIRQVLRECHLPDPESDDAQARAIVSDAFIESLLAASDEGAIREAIEERARLVRNLGAAGTLRQAGNGRPVSRDQRSTDRDAPRDGKAFVRAIT